MATSMHRQRRNVNSADAELCCGTDRLPRKLCSWSRLPRWAAVPASTSATLKVTTPFLFPRRTPTGGPSVVPHVQGQLDLHRNAFTASPTSFGAAFDARFTMGWAATWSGCSSIRSCAARQPSCAAY